MIADEAKSEQFLAAKRLILNPASRIMFLDYVTRDFFAAVAVLARRAGGRLWPGQVDGTVPAIPSDEWTPA